jgi:hypothetical protein
MAAIINYPKSIFLKPLFILLVIILTPLALLFSLVRIPFARRRINKLHETLENDWLPRKKYLYLGFTSNFILSDFVKEKIITRYKEYVVWDEWDDIRQEWKQSEPDENHRVTMFWQDIGGDFDGDPMLIIASYSPGNFEISKENHNFHQFILNDENLLVLNDEKIMSAEDASRKILDIITNVLSNWPK